MSRARLRPRRVAALAAAAVLACAAREEAAGPAPRAIVPDAGAEGQAVAVTILGDGFLAAVRTDFGDSGASAVDARFTARLGATPLRDVALAPDGALSAVVPEAMPPGTYDLVVADPSGREGLLRGAYRVLAADQERLLVAAFRVDPIGPQEAMRPFAVTVTAVDAGGARVPGFAGPVTLSDRGGTAVPRTAGYFVDGRWTGLVEVRAPLAGDVLHVEDALGRTGDSAPFEVAPAPAARLRFATPPRDLAAGGCSEELAVALEDAYGFPTVAASPLPVSLAAADPDVTIFADAACTVPLLAPVLAAGEGTLVVHLSARRAAAPTVDAGAAGLAGDAQVLTVRPGAPAALAFVTSPRVATAGACSEPVTVELRDAFGNAVPAAAAVALATEPAAALALHADAACGAPAASVPLGADARATFHFRSVVAGSARVSAATLGVAASQPATVVPEGAAARLAFVSPPRTTAAGACSDALAVEIQDSYGNAVPVGASVAFASEPDRTFHLDAGCAGPAAGSFDVPVGQSRAIVHVRGTVARSGAVTAAAAGLPPVSQDATVVAAAPARVAFATPPHSVAAGACSPALTVRLLDAFGNVAASPGGALGLAASPAGRLVFHLDAACGAAVTSLALAPGESEATFHFSGAVSGDAEVAVSGAGLAGAAQAEAIVAAERDRLVLAGGGGQVVTAGSCSDPVTLESRDAWGNASGTGAARTIALSAPGAPPDLVLFEGPGCAGAPVSALALPAGASTAVLSFRGGAAAAVSLSAGVAGWAPLEIPAEIAPGPRTALALVSGGAQAPAAGTCSDPVVLRSVDAFGNPSGVAGALAIALAVPGAAPDLVLYDGPGCAGPPVVALAVPDGATTALLSFRGTTAGAFAVDAAVPGWAPLSVPQAVAPAAPAALAFVTVPRVATAGTCSEPVTVELRDGFGNGVPAATDVALGVDPAGAVELFADAACGAPAAAVPLGGDGRASFRFRGLAAGLAQLSASALGLAARQEATVVPEGSASRLAFLTPPRTTAAGACSEALVVETQDSFGNPVAVGTVIALTSEADRTFHLDAACAGAPVAAAVIPPGESRVTAYVRGTRAGTGAVTAAAAALASAAQDATVVAAAPDRVAFTTPPRTVAAGACSPPVGVRLLDAFGNVAASPGLDLALAAAPAGRLAFHGDPACGGAVGAVPIAAGESDATFHFVSAVAGDADAAVSGPGLAGAAQTESVVPAERDRLVLAAGGGQAVTAGACSGPVTLESRDAWGNASATGVARTISLSAPGAPADLFLFAGPGCAGPPVSTLALPAGTASAALSYRGGIAAAVTLTATVAGWAPVDVAAGIVPAPRAALVLVSGGGQTIEAGACSDPVVFRTEDAFGNPSGVAGPILVAVSAPGAAADLSLYEGPGCAGPPVAALPLADGATTASLSYRGTTAGAFGLDAAVPSWLPLAVPEAVAPAAPAALAFVTSPRVATAGACSDPVTVELRDAFGNAAPAAAEVALGVEPAGAVELHSDGACGAATASVPLGADARATFHFRGVSAGVAQVSASALGRSAAQAATIAPEGTAARVVFVSPPRTTAAGACSDALVVESQDSFGNAVAAGAVVALASDPDRTFHLDAACADAPVGAVALGPGESRAAVHLRGTVAGTAAVTAASPGLTAAAQDATVVAAAPERVAFATAPHSLVAGACSPAVTVRLLDAFGNVAASPGLDLGLASAPPGRLAFHLDAACGGATGSVALAAGEREATFHLTGTVAGDAGVAVSAPGIAGAVQAESIVPAARDRLVLAGGGGQVVAAGACSGEVTLASRDAWGNASATGVARTIALSAPAAPPDLAFFAGPGCAGPQVASLALPSGASSAVLSFRGGIAAALTVTAAVAGWAPVDVPAEIVPGPRAALVLAAGGGQAPEAGACSGPVVLRAEDAFGNPSGVAGALTIAVSAPGAAADLALYEGPGCAGPPIAALALADGATTASLSFRGTTAGPFGLEASVPPWAPLAVPEAVAPGPAASLAFGAIPSPQYQAVPFGVTLLAKDAWGNDATSFEGIATFSSPAPVTLECASGCSGRVATVAFTQGAWSGELDVRPGATGVTLVATSGAISGTSGAFDVVGAGARSPPLARISASPVVITTGQSVLLDASGSLDYQTLAADLVLSWDFTGTAGQPAGDPAQGWTAWAGATSVAHAYACSGPAACTLFPRVAVRDADLDVGYATVRVVVLPSATDLCVVSTSADVDDGATSCGGYRGADGALSLPEAIRLSNALPGKQVITFSGPLTIAGAGNDLISADVDVLAPPGVVLDGKGFSIANTPTVLVTGVELRNQPAPLVFPNKTRLTLEDVRAHDMAGFQAYGTATLRRVSMWGCTGACVQTDDPSGVDTLAVEDSSFEGGATGIRMNRCAKGKLALDVSTTVFRGFALAVDDRCPGATRIRHVTFHENGTAIAYGDGDGHVLQNAIFTGHAGAVATCAAGVTFAAREHHLLFGNAAAPSCVAEGDPGTLSGQDPLYLFEPRGDLRLDLASPARNTPLDLTTGGAGMDLNGAAPGRFSGPGPDRGGREGA